MYLKRLSSNMKQFHTVEFKDGLNFIIGKTKDSEKIDMKETYNGLGKSLIIELIHFCLGSDKIKCFEENLKEWIFYLDFEVNGEIFRVERACEKQGEIILNGEVLTISKFKKIMEQKVIGDSKISHLTFRSVLSRFIRRSKASYSKYNIYQVKETDYQKLVNNGYLLGLNPRLIESKMKNRKEIEKLNSAKKAFEKDEVLKEYFTNNEDLDILITDIKEQIKEIEVEIKQFKVAENYKDIQQDANDLSNKKREIQNKIILIENSINKIDKSLEIKADIQVESIVKLYEEAKIVFEDKVMKELDEVTNFHNKLLETRKSNLYKQKQNLLKDKKELEIIHNILGKELDQAMYFLGSHGALDEYKAINDKLNLLKMKLEKATEYKLLIENYDNKISECNIEFEKEKIETNKYIKENTELIEGIMSTFRTYSKSFYKDKASGLDIKVNDKDNKLRFDINAKIIGDSSDGISEVCIFCFDLTLLTLKKTNIRFLFHDSRLLANMDPRQRLSLIKIINEECNKSNIQYIASLNEDLITSISLITDEENYSYYKKIIDDNTILVLTDESDKNKLLGETIDLPYDN